MTIAQITSVLDKPDLFKRISDKMEQLEKETYHSTGVSMHSGGFADAELYNYDEIYADIELKWGIQNDVENTTHTENYRLDLQTMEFK